MQSKITHDDLMRFLDGEVSPEESELITRQLEASTELQRELSVFRSMKSGLQELTFAPAVAGSSVWDQVNHRLARPLGWIFLIIGAVVWLFYAAYLFFTSSAELLLMSIQDC